MSIEEKILNDYKEALRNKDTARSSALSFLRSNLKNAALGLKKDILDDPEAVGVIKKMAKQRKDSIEQFQQGQRDDLVAKETQELEILKSYLPPELSEEEVKKIIEEVIAEIKPTGMKDMGRVMKEVMDRTANSADGKMLSALVKQRLSSIQ